jgi:quinol-cytochrome oxidoreductase complex cytochrome b subunit
MSFAEAARRVYNKLTWTWNPGSDKEAGDAIVKNLLLHWFPNKVSRGSLSWNYSFYLGTISFVLFVILVLTGVVLMFLYVPSVERAYGSVKDIEYVVSFGWLLRGLHRICAHLMVAVVFLHMVRVFLTGAYKNGGAVGANRPLNWAIGIVLLLVTLLLSFTGYLLPWDQLAYWAITVGTNIASAAPLVGKWIRFFLLGGKEIDQNALIRFYVLHVFFLPMIVVFLFSWHMWRVRKDGGLAIVDREVRDQHAEKVAPVRSKTYSLGNNGACAEYNAG